MSFDKFQFRDFVKRTLQAVDLYCEPGVAQVVKTVAKESAGGTYLRQIGGGPALGPGQVEPATEKDLWEHCLKYRPKLVAKITALTGVTGPNQSALEGDLRYNVIMVRVKYLTAKGKLPDKDDIQAQARLWKQHYNTILGSGTVEEFIAAAKKYT